MSPENSGVIPTFNFAFFEWLMPWCTCEPLQTDTFILDLFF